MTIEPRSGAATWRPTGRRRSDAGRTTPRRTARPRSFAGPAARPIAQPPAPAERTRHDDTYSGHATACAAALANLDLLEREDLVGRVRSLEPVLAAAIHRLDGHPLVGETRAVGLTAAAELRPDVLAADPGAVERVASAMRRHGVLTRGLRGVALQVSPPFVITEDEIDLLVDAFGAALDGAAAASRADGSIREPASSTR